MHCDKFLLHSGAPTGQYAPSKLHKYMQRLVKILYLSQNDFADILVFIIAHFLLNDEVAAPQVVTIGRSYCDHSQFFSL